jgi:type IV pilus assembly protein PilX
MIRAQYYLRENRQTQKGAVLIVGLIVVLLMSIIGLAAIRGSGLQEAMAGNMRDRNLAFQAAESGLSAGEANIALTVPTSPICDGTTHGSMKCWFDLSSTTPSGAVDLLTDTLFSAKGILTALGLTYVNSQPTYVLEELTTFSPNDGSGLDESGVTNITKLTPYRTTAKGVGLTAESQVIVQSTYNRSAH